mmetsp:Transcript_22759/g.38894  ORF Transcript_22759/g.38894 Transcript_22759/m.38894 type:complete len:209 (-) Transcript_22759:72-698(-)
MVCMVPHEEASGRGGATRAGRAGSSEQRDPLGGDGEGGRLVLGENELQRVHPVCAVPPDLLPLLHVEEGPLPAAVVEGGERRSEALRVKLAVLEVSVEADRVPLSLGWLGQVERAHAVFDGHPLAAAAVGRHLQGEHLAERLLDARQVGGARLRRVLAQILDRDARRLGALPHRSVDGEDVVVRRDREADELLVRHLDPDALVQGRAV